MSSQRTVPLIRGPVVASAAMRAVRCATLIILILGGACNRDPARSITFPKPTGHVSDFANLLPASVKLELEQVLQNVQQETTAEIALATVISLDGLSVETYARDMFNTWGIGRKGINNGVLVLVSPSDRKMRIQVGYGLEQVLSDELARAIIDTHFLPAFRKNEYAGGIRDGVIEVANIVRRNRGQAVADSLTLERPRGSDAGATSPVPTQLVKGPLALILLVICVSIGADRFGTGIRTANKIMVIVALCTIGAPFVLSSFSFWGWWLFFWVFLGGWALLLFEVGRNPPPPRTPEPVQPETTQTSVEVPKGESSPDHWIVQHYETPFATGDTAGDNYRDRKNRRWLGEAGSGSGGERSGSGGASGSW